MPEVDELVESREFLWLKLFLCEPFALEDFADVSNGLVIVEMNELKGLILQPLKVFIKIRILAYFVNRINPQLRIQPLIKLRRHLALPTLTTHRTLLPQLTLHHHLDFLILLIHCSGLRARPNLSELLRDTFDFLLEDVAIFVHFGLGSHNILQRPGVLPEQLLNKIDLSADVALV